MRLFLLLGLLCCFQPLVAQGKGGVGDLMVIPTRVVLEGRDRSAEVTLRNSGTAPCTYRISFKEMRMLPSGEVEEFTKPDGVLAASDLVRFTPRQVDLAPGESQTVRIQVRLPEGLKDGEYRSHMVFQGLPPVAPTAPIQAGDDKTLSFDIKTLFAISIPVIVRHGETSSTLALTDLAFHPAAKPDEAPGLDLRMVRTGNRSVQGEFKVDWIPQSGKPITLLPVAGGVIYPELDYRTVHMDLPEAKKLDLKGGRFSVTFTQKDGKQAPIVASLALP